MRVLQVVFVVGVVLVALALAAPWSREPAAVPAERTSAAIETRPPAPPPLAAPTRVPSTLALPTPDDDVDLPPCGPVRLEGSIVDEHGRGVPSRLSVPGVRPAISGSCDASGRIVLEAPRGFAWERHRIEITPRGWIPIEVSAALVSAGIVLVAGSHVEVELSGDDARDAELIVLPDGALSSHGIAVSLGTTRARLALPRDTRVTIFARASNGCSGMVDVDHTTAAVRLEILPYVSLRIDVPAARERRRLGLSPTILPELLDSDEPPEGLAAPSANWGVDPVADASSGSVVFPFGDTPATRAWTALCAGCTYSLRYSDELDRTLWLAHGWRADASTSLAFDVPADGWSLDRTRWAARLVLCDAAGALDATARATWGFGELQPRLLGVEADVIAHDDGATFVVHDPLGSASFEIRVAERLVAKGTLHAGQLEPIVVDTERLRAERGELHLPATFAGTRLVLRSDYDRVSRVVPHDGRVPLLSDRWTYELVREDGSLASGAFELAPGGVVTLAPVFRGQASLTVSAGAIDREAAVLVAPLAASPRSVRGATTSALRPAVFAGLDAGPTGVRVVAPSRPGFARIGTRILALCEGDTVIDVDLDERPMMLAVLEAPAAWDLLVVGADGVPWADGSAPLAFAFASDDACRLVARHRDDGRLLTSPLVVGADGVARWEP